MPDCPTCGGSGWNQEIKAKPAHIEAPVTDLRSLEGLTAYVKARLLCPDCDGTGKTEEPKP